MDVIKVFWEEPFALETLSADAEPDARRRDAPLGALDDLLRPAAWARAYLAGTDLARNRTGLTALAHPEAFTAPLLAAFGGPWSDAEGALAPETARQRLAAPEPGTVLAAGPVDPALLAPLAGADRRAAVPDLRAALAAAEAVLLPEPAPEGWDWHVFAHAPLRERMRAAFAAHPVAGARVLAAPYARFRSEHRFYFERWALEPLHDGVAEW